MKKIFLFAAAALAALSVNAKVISFGGIVDNKSEEGAKSGVENAFNLTNITVGAAQNSDQTAWYAEIYQKDATSAEQTDVTTMVLKEDDQVYFTFQDASANKLVAKVYAEYIQANGKAMCMIITGLNAGDKVKINLKKALNKKTYIEGATVSDDMFNATTIELEATGSEIRVYSRDRAANEKEGPDAKWQLVSVEVPDGSQGIGELSTGKKAIKRFENGQLIIIKNGVKYNAIGVKL